MMKKGYNSPDVAVMYMEASETLANISNPNPMDNEGTLDYTT